MTTRGRVMRPGLIFAVSLIAVLGTSIQIAHILFSGEAFCLNSGCKIVEHLTTISPALFNCVGLTFFVVTALLSFLILRAKERSKAQKRLQDLLRLLLLSGIAADGAFIGYQIFVAKTICSYCVTVFGVVLLLNLLAGPRQVVVAVALVISELTAFSLLRFDPDMFLAKTNLDKGTYAIKTCSRPTRNLYLIFSRDCPHCKKVLKTLQGCSQCEFHFNPVERINEMVIPGLIPEPKYDPAINIALLKILSIPSIPVLIDKGPKGMLFIKGDENIIQYVKEHCFSPIPSLEQGLLLEFNGEQGVCSIEKECNGQ